MALEPLNKISFSNESVVVTLSCGRTAEGHAGLGLYDETGRPIVYHLNNHHCVLIEDAATKPDCWLVQPLPLPTGGNRHLAIYVRGVIKSLSANNNNVAFGIDFIAAHGSFSSSGDYTPPAGSSGLTCASFVVEILKGGMVDLIDASSWMPSAENDAWAEELAVIFGQMSTRRRQAGDVAKADAFLERMDAIRRSSNGLRLMPTEVAGAASLQAPDWPATYRAVQSPAQDFKRELAAVC